MNKFDTLQEMSETNNPNGEFENFVTAHMVAAATAAVAAAGCIPTKPRARY